MSDAHSAESVSRARRWNGYGLSFWSCKCGARRRVESLRVNEFEGRLIGVNATPCKRCGNTDEPVTGPFDPWAGYAEDPLGGSWS